MEVSIIGSGAIAYKHKENDLWHDYMWVDNIALLATEGIIVITMHHFAISHVICTQLYIINQNIVNL